jgi:hypothetical protein
LLLVLSVVNRLIFPARLFVSCVPCGPKDSWPASPFGLPEAFFNMGREQTDQRVCYCFLMYVRIRFFLIYIFFYDFSNMNAG